MNRVMNKQPSKVTIGNGKIKLQGDFTGLLILKKSSNLDGFELQNTTNAFVLGTGRNNPPKFWEKIKTIKTIWKWL